MSLVCAVVAAVSGNVLVLRLLVAASAATAVTGAVIMRAWDRAAGKRVAEVTKARVRDEWRTDERIAELETDLEESRELRLSLDTKLRAKRAELSRLRNEHATLLRRYANAETQRASALEGRRLLSLGAPQEVRELPAGTGRSVAPTPGGLGPAGYRRAHTALRNLVRNGARQEIKRTIEEARRREAQQEAEEAAGKLPAAAGEHEPGTAAATSGPSAHGRRTAPAATAVAPDRRFPKRVEGGFDFFGTQGLPAPEGPLRTDSIPAAVPEDDLADVVGAEAFAEYEARQEQHRASAEAERETVDEVIDLTEHDETEPLDMRELRVHSS
ncbi:hypothetical protein [Streptomyces meridianus]|uniref:hypothetical protein n=1 Tax=Streptomyces meridianus TaxID=2938945 RepID=UPI0027E28808|nr:hypothetical protein [Streptomyces meridianus]